MLEVAPFIPSGPDVSMALGVKANAGDSRIIDFFASIGDGCLTHDRPYSAITFKSLTSQPWACDSSRLASHSKVIAEYVHRWLGAKVSKQVKSQARHLP